MKRLTLIIAALTIALTSAAQTENDSLIISDTATENVAAEQNAAEQNAAQQTAAEENEAQEMPGTVKKQRFLPMSNRIDRDTRKHSFAYKGEVMIGATVSYGTLSSDNTDLYLLLDNLKLNGSVVTVNPYIGYFVANNQAIGLRFGYTHMYGRMGNITLDLGEQNDVQMSLGGMDYTNNNYSFGIYHRSYAPLDAKGRFGLFSELELMAVTGTQSFGYTSDGERKESNSDIFRIKLNFNPGLAVYIFPNVCGTISFGLGGIQYNRISQSDETGAFTGLRQTSKMQFKLNLTDIRIGMTIHLWNKKKE